MLLKDFTKRLKTIDYFYLVKSESKLCIEFTDKNLALAYFKAFGGQIYAFFPYEDCGYEDPYTFSKEWTIMNEDGDY